jgi:carbamoyltransferase
MSKIIGLYGTAGWVPEDAWLHSAGASLWIDGKHISTISEERLTREKHDGNFPNLSIDYVLEVADITRDDIDLVSYVESVHSVSRKDSIESIFNREFSNATIKFCDHHKAHASASFYTSPFSEASILSFDGAGSAFIGGGYETGLYAIGDKKEGIYVVYHSINGNKQHFTFNLGQIYNNISRWCYSKIEPKKAAAFTNPYIFMETAPGKIMGLSAYGDKDKVDLPNLFALNNDKFYFPYIYDNAVLTDAQLDKYDCKDVAAWLQFQFEQILVEFFKKCPIKSGNLVLGGGCGLNVLANSAIKKTGVFEDIFIFPATNDSGLCFGGAISEVVKEEKEIKDLGYLGFLGKQYSESEIEDAIQEIK